MTCVRAIVHVSLHVHVRMFICMQKYREHIELNYEEKLTSFDVAK